MPLLPPLPPFEGLHPIVVHFPIGVLLTAWVPAAIGIVDAKRRNTWFACTAVLLVVGTAAAFAAVLTGEAAEDVVAPTSQLVEDAIHEHEETAELARNLFIAATLVYLAAWAVLAKAPKKKKALAATAAGVLAVGTYAAAAITLINAGHQGGVLVHQHAVHAPITAPPPSAATPDRHDDHDEDDD